jgi:hypothetical protein
MWKGYFDHCVKIDRGESKFQGEEVVRRQDETG